MRLFTISEDGKLIPYNEYHFKEFNQEIDLEILLEDNPEYFFEGTKILIIGRQVATNLNTFIDLLGIDKNGNTIVIELKREKTPRETIAQILEYASFVENLDYSQLNEIYQDYSGEGNSLEDYHRQYFQNELNDEKVAFNKSTKMVIIAEEISKEIKQTALFLRKKGIDIYCIEFKYFVTDSGKKVITSDFIVGDEEFIRERVKSASLPKINKKQFLESLDKNGLKVFQMIFEFVEKNNLMFRWGSKGFSLNVQLDSNYVALFFGYPPNSVFKQSIYTGFEEISKKINYSEEVIKFYKEALENLGYFTKAGGNLKWIIDRDYGKDEINQFLQVVGEVISKIKGNGLK